MAERKKIKLKKTRGGAQQYERSKGDFGRHSDNLFHKLMADPLGDPDILEKKARLRAGEYGASKYDDDAELEEMLMGFAEREAKERRNRPVEKAKGGAVKKYMGGGKVRGYEHGGGVCRGGGAAISGTKFSGVK
jgi:hypothetical protein